MAFAVTAILILEILLKVWPHIWSLVQIAEKAFDGIPDSGVEKKVFVVNGAKTIVMGMKEVSTGGQLETWQRLEAPIGKIVDGVAAILFPHDEQGGPN